MTTFSEFKLLPAVHKALEEKNFIEPTPVQEKVIPHILDSNQDIIAIAQTGTGKTAAFGLPVLSKMSDVDQSIQTVILSPTRELAMQIADDMRSFSKYLPRIKVIAVYGGSSIQDQIYAIKRGANVVVGTPGRMLDLIKRGVLKLGGVKWMILDEADEMLKMGFVEDISEILASTPETKQTLLFSATMSRTIEQIARSYMHSPVRIEAKLASGKNLAITHQYMIVPARDKVTALQRYRELNPGMYGIVFCRTKREAQEIGDAMLKDGYPTGVLHGDIEQSHRTRIMEAFKKKETSFLVATDVAARGIDVAKLTHVIHIGVPEKFESYVHRSGRTGRASEKGISMVLAHLREHRALKRIEQMNGITFQEIPVPKREDIIKADINRYVQSVDSDFEVSKMARKYVDEIIQNVPQEEMDGLAKKLLLHAVEERIAKYPEKEMDKMQNRPQSKNSSGIRGREGSYGREGGRGGQGGYGGEGMKTLVISLGRRNALTVPHLLGMINEVSRGERVDIGQIEIGDTQASFEAPSNFVTKLCREMSANRFRGQKVYVREGAPVRRSSRRR
ncbi:DEAD/DEAH box helicase [bacterium]|nr:DEAD/DEAH box helicase [bacterium]